MSRLKRVRNEKVRRQMGIDETIIKGIERKQLVWHGYVQRMFDARLAK